VSDTRIAAALRSVMAHEYSPSVQVVVDAAERALAETMSEIRQVARAALNGTVDVERALHKIDDLAGGKR